MYKKSICWAGYEDLDGNGVCTPKEVEPQPSITCKNGTIESGKCVCWAGYEDLDGNGVCTPINKSEE